MTCLRDIMHTLANYSNICLELYNIVEGVRMFYI